MSFTHGGQWGYLRHRCRCRVCVAGMQRVYDRRKVQRRGGIEPQEVPNWPFDAVQRFLGAVLRDESGDIDNSRAIAAELCGVSTRTINRWKTDGVPDVAADHVAIHLGVHPCVIWGDAWWESAPEEAVA